LDTAPDGRCRRLVRDLGQDVFGDGGKQIAHDQLVVRKPLVVLLVGLLDGLAVDFHGGLLCRLSIRAIKESL
jgi:hypothetical protein